jgi:hypothetical protein
MSKESVKVECSFCKKSYAAQSLPRHFLSCEEKKLKNKVELKSTAKTKPISITDNRIFLIKIFSPEEPQYWLIIEAKAKVTLRKLDSFLRDIWLECCGHLSQFKIDGIQYEFPMGPADEYFGRKPKSMNFQLGQVLSPGLQLDYIYDFGSTTYLKLKMIGERIGSLTKKSIKLLARNPEPEYYCIQCEQKPDLICAFCGEVYCEPCSEDHEETDHAFLPLVNSPRTGVCGYTGPTKEI